MGERVGERNARARARGRKGEGRKVKGLRTSKTPKILNQKVNPSINLIRFRFHFDLIFIF